MNNAALASCACEAFVATSPNPSCSANQPDTCSDEPYPDDLCSP